jgi:hypothetical protein
MHHHLLEPPEDLAVIVGVDVSSRRIDLAWLENGKPQRWHQELGGPKTHLIDRLRLIAVRWPPMDALKLIDVTDIAIEMPFGQSRTSIGALMAVVGIITSQAPPWARVAWPSSGELRQALGARNTKDSAHLAIRTHFHHGDTTFHCDLDGWDEHELDALTACIGWTRILQAQDDAA